MLPTVSELAIWEGQGGRSEREFQEEGEEGERRGERREERRGERRGKREEGRGKREGGGSLPNTPGCTDRQVSLRRRRRPTRSRR
jgi:hypothetical protein